MRLLSYSVDGTPSFGLLTADGTGVIDLAGRIDDAADLSDLIAQRRIGEAARWAGIAAVHVLDDITFERLLPRPNKILCIGVNYGGRGAEYAENRRRRLPQRVRALPRDAGRPRAAPAATPRIRAARLRGRDRRRDRHRRAPDTGGPGPQPHRRSEPRQRRHHPGLDTARPLQRHPGQELAPQRLARDRGW